MPRRSTRNKQTEQKEADIVDEHEPSKTDLKPTKSSKSDAKSASNESANMSLSPEKQSTDENRARMSVDVNENDTEQKETGVDLPSKALKRLSIDPNSAMPATSNKEQDKAKEPEEEYIDDMPDATLARTRVRRSNRPTISYKDESSEEESSESESEDCDDPLFAGLSKAQRTSLRAKMSGMQNNYKESKDKEKTLKINEIISSFDFNCGEKVTNDEAAFMYEFCAKHQYDINDKIEDEGDFFLVSMREMMEEKRKLNQAQNGGNGNKNKKNKGKKNQDSDSEFDADAWDEESDSDGSDYSYSDWEDPDQDNENLVSDDDEDWNGRKKKKRRRRKNKFSVDGREYHCAGRLLLEDALKDTENFEGWSAARVQAWKNKEHNPNAYFYRFNAPNEKQKNGPVLMDEHKVFMDRIMEVGVNMHWGKFSMKIPGRVGYQCSNYWRQMMKDQWVKDPNYWIRADGSFCFKRAKKGSVPDAIRKYSFVVLKDPSKVFDQPGYHPKRPSDAKLKKYLEDGVRDIVNKKKGGKGKKKRVTKNSTKNDDDKKDDGEEKKVVKRVRSKGNKKPKDPNKPKNPMSSYLLFCNDVRAKFMEENKGQSMGKISKLISVEWKALSEEDKKQYVDKSVELRAKWKEEMEEYKKSDKYTEFMDVLKKWNEDQMKDEEEDKDKVKEEEKVEAVAEDKHDSDKENKDPENKARGKKRKHSDDEMNSDLEPPQKKRKISPKKKSENKSEKKSKKKKKKAKKEEEKEVVAGPLSEVLGDMVDIMTGEALQTPAISPYGHVMEYNSWCTVLRNPKTKNMCPFTKQKMTRRSLVKLDTDNIDEYKDKIVNITAEDMKCLNQ